MCLDRNDAKFGIIPQSFQTSGLSGLGVTQRLTRGMFLVLRHDELKSWLFAVLTGKRRLGGSLRQLKRGECLPET